MRAGPSRTAAGRFPGRHHESGHRPAVALVHPPGDGGPGAAWQDRAAFVLTGADRRTGLGRG